MTRAYGGRSGVNRTAYTGTTRHSTVIPTDTPTNYSGFPVCGGGGGANASSKAAFLRSP